MPKFKSGKNKHLVLFRIVLLILMGIFLLLINLVIYPKSSKMLQCNCPSAASLDQTLLPRSSTQSKNTSPSLGPTLLPRSSTQSKNTSPSLGPTLLPRSSTQSKNTSPSLGPTPLPRSSTQSKNTSPSLGPTLLPPSSPPQTNTSPSLGPTLLPRSSTQSKNTSPSLGPTLLPRSSLSTEKIQKPENGYYLCPKLKGGLGNLMFQYASVYGIARSTGRQLFMEHNSMESVFEHLNGTVNNELCNSTRLKELTSKTHCSYDPNLLQIPAQHNYLVGDYLQSFKYFENYQNEIRQQFIFKQELKDKAREGLQEIAENFTRSLNYTLSTLSVTFISVHVRRGDMLELSRKMEYGYQIPKEDYILKAMAYMKTIYFNIAFVFASNDMKWVKSKFQGKDIFFPKLTDAHSQFAILSSCNHSITSVGTYGWWSAYLAGGTTLYYKFPAREGSELRKQFSSDYKDFFLRGWIELG